VRLQRDGAESGMIAGRVRETLLYSIPRNERQVLQTGSKLCHGGSLGHTLRSSKLKRFNQRDSVIKVHN
jgi:hypothetical protein